MQSLNTIVTAVFSFSEEVAENDKGGIDLKIFV